MEGNVKYSIRRERLPKTLGHDSCMAWIVRGPDGFPVAQVGSEIEAQKIAKDYNANPLPAHA